MLGLIGSLLWIGFAAWRAAAGRRREAYAALLRGDAGLRDRAPASTGSGRSPALGAVFFLAAGALVAARCAQIARRASAEAAGSAELRPRRRRRSPSPGSRRSPWSARCWSTTRSTASQNAVADGDIASAVDHADTARSIEPWAASPYLQLGLIAERQGEYPLAIQRLSQAIEREERQLGALLPCARGSEAEGGELPPPRTPTSKRRANSNPLAPQLKAAGE